MDQSIISGTDGFLDRQHISPIGSADRLPNPEAIFTEANFRRLTITDIAQKLDPILEALGEEATSFQSRKIEHNATSVLLKETARDCQFGQSSFYHERSNVIFHNGSAMQIGEWQLVDPYSNKLRSMTQAELNNPPALLEAQRNIEISAASLIILKEEVNNRGSKVGPEQTQEFTIFCTNPELVADYLRARGVVLAHAA